MYSEVIINTSSDETVNSRTMVRFKGLVWSSFLIGHSIFEWDMARGLYLRKDTEKAHVTRRLNYVIETSQPL